MGVRILDKKRKPSLWQLNPSLVVPEWQWAWDKLRIAYVINESGGMTLHDVIHRNDAQFVNDPAWTMGTLGREVAFDGGNDYVLQDEVIGSLDDFTIVIAFSTVTVLTGWTFRVVNDGSFEIVGLQLNTDENGISNTDSLFWQLRDSAGLAQRNVSYNDATWRDGAMHIHALVRKGSDSKMYLDGVEKTLFVGTNTLTTASIVLDEYKMPIAADNLRGTVGSWAVIDVAFWGLWGRALNGAEIAALARDPFGPFHMARRRIGFVAVVGGQTIAVGQVTESDTAQGLTVLKQRTLVQAVEADLAQAISSAKARAIGQVTEADLSQGLSAAKARGVNQVTEIDLAQAMAWAPRHRLVGRVTETNLAQVLGRLKALGLGQVTETDLAQAMAWAPMHRLVGPTIETDLAQTIGRLKSRAVGQIMETDLAQALAVVKALAVAQISETDLAQPISVAGEFFIGVGQVTEADLAQAVSWAPTRLVAQISETDLAQSLSVLKLLGVGQVVETDLGQALGVLRTYGVNQVAEVDLARSLSVLRTYGVGQVTEVDLAQGVNAQRHYVVAQVTETDLARVLSYFRVVHVGTVVETDVALVISISGGAPIALPPYLGGVGSPLLVFGGGVAEAIVVFGGGVAVSVRVFGGDVDLPEPAE